MESHPLVYIRTDGNETIATGHLMRCLSIARALKKRGAAAVSYTHLDVYKRQGRNRPLLPRMREKAVIYQTIAGVRQFDSLCNF